MKLSLTAKSIAVEVGKVGYAKSPSHLLGRVVLEMGMKVE